MNNLLNGGPISPKTKFNVSSNRKVGKQGIVLEYGAHIALVGLAVIDQLTFKQNVSRRALLKTRNQTKRSSLSAARRTKQREKATLRNHQRNAGHSPLAGKILNEVAYL